MDPSSPQVSEAVEELHLYLSDILPPLVVVDAFKLLFQFPPALVASRLREWISSQHRPDGGISLSDYTLYAMRKVNLMGEFQFVPREQFDQFLEALKDLVLDLCPAEEHETLRENLTRLSEGSGTPTGSEDALIPPEQGPEGLPAEAPSLPSFSAEEVRALRHFSLLLRRIGQATPAEGAPGVLALALAAAARASRNSEEFEQNVGTLRELGWAVDTPDIFRALGNSLPGWIPPEPGPEGGEGGEGAVGPEAPESGPVKAMHRIVVQPGDPAEVARRFQALVKSAVERFNEGALPRAVLMLGLAERVD
jgi:hypothetical protein